MIYKILAVSSIVLLAGCASPKIQTEHKFIVVEPPATLLNCPSIPSKPPSENLTNQGVVNYINKLEKNLNLCSVNASKTKQYIEEMKKLYD